MAFQIRDVTDNLDLMYVDNSNQMGLGSLPVNGQALTIQGNGFVNQAGDLGDSILGPGGQVGYEGAFAPGAISAVVTISTTQQPTVSASQPPVSITTNQVSFLLNGETVQSTINYSIW